MKLCPTCQRCYDDADAVCPHDQSALVPSHPGSRLIVDKYRLDRLLGRGGMGAVYAGTHVDLERPVAIKLLLPDLISDAEAMERFRREAKAAARLNHPNVADTYDYGMLPHGGAYIVMELVNGITLRDFMNARGPLPTGIALHLTWQIAQAIEAAHEGGIVHRDLKPSNIVLRTERDGGLEAKVVDFGVAKLKEQTTSTSGITGTGSLIGTPRYMSPEQCSGQKTDARSDIYSLGVILYEMLTGQAPFDAPTATAIAIKHIQEAPPSIRTLRPDLPAQLDQLMDQVLAKDPDARPQTAAEFARRLQEAVGESPQIWEAQAKEAILVGQQATVTSSDATKTGAVPGPDTNPSPPRGSQTQRTNHPTEESISAPHEFQDAPSVIAYDAAHEPPGAQTATEPAPRPLHPQDEVEAVAASSTSLTGQAKSLKEPKSAAPGGASSKRRDEPFSPVPEEPGSRTPVLLYASLGLITLLALGVILWILWPAQSRQQSAHSNSGESQSHAHADAGNTATDSVTNNSSERAGAANQTANQASNQPPPASTSSTSPNGSGDAPAELRVLLNDWVTATNARDVNRQMAFYAPTLETFYLRRNAPREAVREEKARLFSQLQSVNVTTNEPEVSVSGDGRTATLRFHKSWNFTGARPDSGEVIQELRWRKTDAGWKIISERDLQRLR